MRRSKWSITYKSELSASSYVGCACLFAVCILCWRRALMCDVVYWCILFDCRECFNLGSSVARSIAIMFSVRSSSILIVYEAMAAIWNGPNLSAAVLITARLSSVALRFLVLTVARRICSQLRGVLVRCIPIDRIIVCIALVPPWAYYHFS